LETTKTTTIDELMIDEFLTVKTTTYLIAKQHIVPKSVHRLDDVAFA